jgi:hypothetical protein
MISFDREMEYILVEKSKSQHVQWWWLPILLAFSAIWFYGLWCLANKIF